MSATAASMSAWVAGAGGSVTAGDAWSARRGSRPPLPTTVQASRATTRIPATPAITQRQGWDRGHSCWDHESGAGGTGPAS
jgi:hypothetical protein